MNNQLFPTITPDVCRRYYQGGKKQENAVRAQIAGEGFSASLRSEDPKAWMGPDEEEDDDGDELPEGT